MKLNENYINGIMAIIKERTINDCSDKIANVIEIIMTCIKI